MSDQLDNATIMDFKSSFPSCLCLEISYFVSTQTCQASDIADQIVPYFSGISLRLLLIQAPVTRIRVGYMLLPTKLFSTASSTTELP
jgi:hypothetical protein